MLWDVFCRVIDNFGDIGVCWRLAADLAERGESVRLWTDDAGALAWMAPQGHPGVSVRAWDARACASGDVVIEAFGCDPPARFVERIALSRPVWINLEYLSAEPYAQRSHGLPSPVSQGPAKGLTKWFYYPGFTVGSGGLLRERGLLAARQAFDTDAWLQARGVARRRGERVVSLFCYASAPVEALVGQLGARPTLLLATPGPAADAVQRSLGPGLRRGALRAELLPALTQGEYDRLLWASDLNFVRGEDSFVRAQWAGQPFVWQAYPQDDAAHEAKLEAHLALLLATAAPAVSADSSAQLSAQSSADLNVDLRATWRAWNGLAPWPATGASAAGARWPEPAAWRALAREWRDHLARQSDLASQLQAFVAGKR